MNSTTICPSDFSFGPAVEDCSRTFDFTLTFEESILSVVPSALLILLAPIRIISLQGQRRRVGGRSFQLLKLISIAVFAALQLTLLVLWCLQVSGQTLLSVASAILSFIDSLMFCLLSYNEHSKSLRPSTILGVYLFFSLLFDAVRLRTLWLLNYDGTIRTLFTVSLSAKVMLLVLEAREKRQYLSNIDRQRGPEETTSIFNQSVFWWLNKLIARGFRGILLNEDLFPIDEAMSSELLSAQFARKWEADPGSGQYKLLKVSVKLFKWDILAPIFPRLVLVGFTFCQPLLINRFLQFLQDPDESMNVGYALIGAYGIVYFGLAISTGFYWHKVYRFIAIVRGSYVSAIYRKTTGISITELDNSAAVTLMSTDIERIGNGLRSLHEIWANIIQVALSTWLLQRELGVACLPPVIIAIASGAGTFCMSFLAGPQQKKWVNAIQIRVGVTSTMLGSMKGVKMSGLTNRLAILIQRLRIDELIAGTAFRMVLVWTAVIAFVPVLISPVVTFGVFVGLESAQGRALDTTRMFTSLSLLLLLAQPLSQLFQALPHFSAALGCVDRIQKFLVTSSKADHRLLTFVPSIPSQTRGVHTRTRVPDDIELVHMSKFSNSSAPVNHGTDVILVRDGAFGWKKEDPPVLKDINLSVPKGSLTIFVGPVASGKTTLLKAFLGETPSSKGFVHISTLDFSFCDQTPWLLSQSVQKNIVGFADFHSSWYNSVLYACALDEDIALFPNGDQTMIGSNGITLSGGQKQRVAIARAVYARKEVAIFDDVFSGLDATTEKRVFERLFGPTGLLLNLLPSADQIIVVGADGTIVEQGTFDHLNATDGYVRSFALQQASKSTEGRQKDASTAYGLGPKQASPQNGDLGDKTRQMGDLSVYKYYFGTVGRTQSTIFFVLAISSSFFDTFPTVWLKWWSDAASTSEQNTGKYLGVYAALQIGAVLIILAFATHCFNTMTLVSGKKLHEVALGTVMAYVLLGSRSSNAPMAFFSTTDTGVTLNRFSQDISLIDSELPSALLNFSNATFTAIGQAAMIASASPYIALAYPFVLFIFYLIQRYYLRTSRQLRFMDLEAKSPLYTQFLESLSGLATIRAFGWQEPNQALNAELLDMSQKPFYLLFMIQRWLTLVMDLIGMGLALVVVGIAVKLRDSVSPGFAGVSLVSIISFTETLKWLILHWTNLETSIGAVSRVKSFETTTEPENLPNETQSPPENWPSRGLVEVNDMSASYKAGKNALSDISLTIRPGEKIGICGRSGSGKSSVVLALFRMIELSGGTILIDDLDISTLPRHDVRSRLNAIPQDPYFLHGSIRSNLDPWETHSDDKLEAALRKVELWAKVESVGGLDTEMDVDFLSHGQRQLFCLARAILRPGKIVVLDEATSSVDRKTDDMMQRIIREAFSNHTIIAVAHRLETILDFDRIVVLDKGILIECDSPKNLLGRKSMFRDLYETYEKKKDEKTSEA